jgi:sugar/nucleoside kinase (ribokinase family)
VTRVICLGDVMTDVVAKLSGPLAIGSDAPATVRMLGGGAGANTACWLAAAGVAVVFVGCVGDDGPGREAVAALRDAGVRLAVTVDPDRPTGTCVVLVSDTGERTMIPDAGANSGLQPGDLPDGLFTGAGHLHVSGYSLLSEATRPAAMTAMWRAREHGWPVSVDAASSAPIRAVGAAAFLGWIGSVTPLFANADEATALTGVRDPVTAATALSVSCGQAVVKRGAGAAIWARDGVAVEVPTTPVPSPDTTGAGDAFAAGFLAARLGGIGPELSVSLGHRYAARAVSQVGGRPRPVSQPSEQLH